MTAAAQLLWSTELDPAAAGIGQGSLLVLCFFFFYYLIKLLLIELNRNLLLG